MVKIGGPKLQLSLFFKKKFHLDFKCILSFFSALPPWQAYRSSMLKAFKKTVEEGVFTFIIGMHHKNVLAKLFLKQKNSTILDI
jgi:hypothetical protein